METPIHGEASKRECGNFMLILRFISTGAASGFKQKWENFPSITRDRQIKASLLRRRSSQVDLAAKCGILKLSGYSA